MKKMMTFKDDVVGVPYDLCAITYSELKAKVIADSRMDENEIAQFNSEGERQITQIVKEPNLKDYASEFSCFNLPPEYKKHKMDYEEYITNEKLKVEKATIKKEKTAWGIEQYNFIVEEDTNGGWILLDGFNRLFGSYYDNGDKELILKVYPTLSRDEYSNLVDNVNSWKREKEGYGGLFFDRGIRWSMFLKYGFEVKDIYEKGDIMSGYFFPLHPLKFFEFFTALNQTGNIVDNIDLLMKYEEEKAKTTSGSFMKYPEMELAILNEVGKEPMFKNVEDMVNLYKVEQLQNDFKKISSYKVAGTAENYFKYTLKEKIISYIKETVQKKNQKGEVEDE